MGVSRHADQASAHVVPKLQTGANVSNQPSCQNSSLDRRVEKYLSKDSSTGRVWGMPSAFGKGQCSDCPAKAMPPHMRCEACQKIHQSRLYPPMAEADVRGLRDALQPLRVGPAWDTWHQVDELCSLLQ